MNENLLDFFCGGFIGLLGWFFGGLDGFIKVLVTFSIIDYFTGVAVAYYQHNISSRIGLKGILKKCVMFSLVGLAHIIDKNFLGDTATIRTAVVLFYVGNEGISIMENAYTLGVPFPKALQKHLLQFATEDDIDTTEIIHDENHDEEGDDDAEDDTPEG